MSAKGSRVVLEDVLDRVRLATGVSTSPMVNEMGLVVAPWVMGWAEIVVIVGAVLGGA